MSNFQLTFHWSR